MRIARRLANAGTHLRNARVGLKNAKTTWRIIRGKATKSELICRRVELEAAKEIHAKALLAAAKHFWVWIRHIKVPCGMWITNGRCMGMHNRC